MEKHSVNLIIKKETDSALVVKLKTFLPIIAVAALLLFVVSFLASLIYINNNNKEFKSLKTQSETLEKQITDKKNIEGIYTLTVQRIKTIDQLSSGNKNFAKLLFEILKLQSTGINFTQTSIDKKNAVNIAVIASSSATLDDFVTRLIEADTNKLFSDIKTSGIVRDKTGGYLLSISAKPSTKLLE